MRETLPEEVESLDTNQRRFLGMMAEKLGVGMDGTEIHNLIHELAGEIDGVPASDLFRALYLALLGKNRGPRAGSFITILGIKFCSDRFAEAAGGGK